MSEWTRYRAELAAKSKRLRAGDPELEKVRQKSRGAYVYEHVEKLIDGWPPLSNEQLANVASLLLAARTRNGGDGDGSA